MASLHRLDSSREHELVLAATDGDAEARDRLVINFMPLIGRVARMYRYSAGVDHGELMQEGVVGLLRALRHFDPDVGTPFWAYASWWVRQAMQGLVSELTWPSVLSDRALRELARVKAAQRSHVQTHGREPTPAELALATGLRRDQVQRLIAAERRARSLHEPSSGHEGGATLADLLADPHGEDAFDRVDRDQELAQLPRLLHALTARETTVVRGHFGLDGDEHTLRELGVTLGVSAERVRQIERDALGKMRAAAG
jgi:RNA polymerase sigma factor (sigma-70 family)